MRTRSKKVGLGGIGCACCRFRETKTGAKRAVIRLERRTSKSDLRTWAMVESCSRDSVEGRQGV